MCVGIIGHCSCVRCLELKNPGKLLRVEFCKAQQDKLGPAWNSRWPILACKDISFSRVYDPNSCHFKENTAAYAELLGAESADERADEHASTAAQADSDEEVDESEEEEDPSGPGTSSFTAVNRKSAVCAREKDNDHPPRVILSDAADRERERGEESAGAASAMAPKPDNNNVIKKRTPLPTSRPRPVPVPAAAAAARFTTPDPERQSDGNTTISESPSSQPLVRESDGATPGRGPWTVEETIKLLALKSKGLRYHQLQQVCSYFASFGFRRHVKDIAYVLTRRNSNSGFPVVTRARAWSGLLTWQLSTATRSWSTLIRNFGYDLGWVAVGGWERNYMLGALDQESLVLDEAETGYRPGYLCCWIPAFGVHWHGDFHGRFSRTLFMDTLHGQFPWTGADGRHKA
jgi:hypothetical protein